MFHVSNSCRPQFIAVYIEEPDHSGHVGGPDSTEVNSTLSEIDHIIQTLFSGLEERGIKDCVNVLFVSDHGMVKYDPAQLVHLDQVITYVQSRCHACGWYQECITLLVVCNLATCCMHVNFTVSIIIILLLVVYPTREHE